MRYADSDEAETNAIKLGISVAMGEWINEVLSNMGLIRHYLHLSLRC